MHALQREWLMLESVQTVRMHVFGTKTLALRLRVQRALPPSLQFWRCKPL
jgi:hypothetical protein